VAFPAEVSEHRVDRGLINFFAVRRRRFDWWRFHQAAPGTLECLSPGGPYPKIEQRFTIDVPIARVDGGGVGVNHRAECDGVISSMEGGLGSRPAQ
jgi:hypothetical protein